MKAIRQVGIGDIGHVRNQLLSVAIISKDLSTDQLDGAIRAADELGMRLRAHVLVEDVVTETNLNSIIMHNMSADHQLETYYGEIPAHILSTCEIILQPEGNEAYTADETKYCIIETWNRYGGRFAGGNFARHDAETLKRMYLDN